MSNTEFKENSTLMKKLKTALFVEYNKEREGIHVSDVILCPRETCFRRLKPEKITDIEVNFFTSGRAIHDAIQTLARYYPEYEIEKELEFIPIRNKFTKGITENVLNGKAKDFKIVGHVDIYDKENNIPIEAKSVRAGKLANNEAKPHHVEQLKTYMAITDADTGYILYQMLLNYNSYPFLVYEVTLNKTERTVILQNLVKDALGLVMGLHKKDASLVKHIANDDTKNWKCNHCKFFNQCYEMRVKAGEIKGLQKK